MEAVTAVAVTGAAVDEGDGVAVGLGLLTAPAVAVGEGGGVLSGLAVVVGVLVAVAVGVGDALGDVEEPRSFVAVEQGMKVYDTLYTPSKLMATPRSVPLMPSAELTS